MEKPVKTTLYKKWADMTIGEKMIKKGIRFVQCPGCGRVSQGYYAIRVERCGKCGYVHRDGENTEIVKINA